MAKFVIELPVDKYANTGMPLCVIEVEIEARQASFEFEEDFWHVLAPPTISESWHSLYLHPQKYIEVEGPARELTVQEWCKLIIDNPDIPEWKRDAVKQLM